jgi:hypothetical protein
VFDRFVRCAPKLTKSENVALLVLTEVCSASRGINHDDQEKLALAEQGDLSEPSEHGAWMRMAMERKSSQRHFPLTRCGPRTT